jgi:hypothetical protein
MTPGARCAGRQDGTSSRPTSSNGPGGPGFNQIPHQHPYLSGQQPPQSYGGQTTGLSYSASTSSSYSNATASWKKQQTGVLGLAKDTMDKFTGKETRKNVQSSVQSACFLFVCFYVTFLSRESMKMGGLGHIFRRRPSLVHPAVSICVLHPAPRRFFF